MQNSKSIRQKIEEDPEMKNCFETLPEIIKETIIMSGADIGNAAQLRSVAEELMKKGRE